MKTAFAAVLLLLGSMSTARAADVDPRADFLKLIDRPKVPLAAEIRATASANGTTEYYFTFATQAGQRVPGILFKPADARGRLPLVIALHGTGGDKKGEIPFLRKLVARGFMAVAIDAPYHGERSKAGKGSVEYVDAILRAWHEQKEHPFFFDTVWDVMRLVDYLETRDDVDAQRIGLYGVSKGGIEAYLTAAVDTRIAAAVPCIAVESFRWANENDSWHSRIGTIQAAFDAAARESNVSKPDGAFVHAFYERVAPGIDREFDGPSMVPLIAPRPLMCINGEIDPRTPLPGLKLCTDAAQKIYDAANAQNRFVVRIQPNTPHRVNPDSQSAAVEFLTKWLIPTAQVTH